VYYRTWSTAWYTPLLAGKSNLTTNPLFVGEETCTNFPLFVTSSSPPAVLRLVLPSGIAVPCMLSPGTTCLSKVAFSFSLLAMRAFKSFMSTLSKAELVGAKSVKGPSPARVSKSSAALSAANSVEKCSFSSSRSLRLLSPRGLLPREDGLGVLLVGPTGLLERLLRLPVSLEGMGGLAA